MTLSDLISKLEGVTEGSRELDAEIAIAADLVPPYESGLAESYDYAYEIVEDWGERWIRRMPRNIATGKVSEHAHGRYKAPAYTTSVDAALTLVPPDHDYWIMTPGRDNGTYINAVKVRIISPLSSGGGPHWEAFAPTAALAIVLASLKSRSV